MAFARRFAVPLFGLLAALAAVAAAEEKPASAVDVPPDGFYRYPTIGGETMSSPPKAIFGRCPSPAGGPAAHRARGRGKIPEALPGRKGSPSPPNTKAMTTFM